MIEKKQLDSSSVKAQFSHFQENFTKTLVSSCDEFKHGDVPLRGPALLSMCSNLFFGFKSWESLRRQSLNSEDNQDKEVYIYDENFLSSNKEKSAKYLKKNFLPYLEQEHVERLLTASVMHLPKERSRTPLTKEGKKLCFDLCENHTRLTTLKSNVIVHINSSQKKGILAYFSQTPSFKHGGVESEYGKVYVEGMGMIDVPIKNIKAAESYDPFKQYRKLQVLSFAEICDSDHNGKFEPSGIHYERLYGIVEKGKKISVVIRHPLSQEVHEYPVGNFTHYGEEVARLRELYHDTQDLIWIAK